MAQATYSIQELVQVAQKFFKQNGVLVEAALKGTGKKSFTIGEAKQIIREFAKREVNLYGRNLA